LSRAGDDAEAAALARVVAAVRRTRGIDLAHYKRAFLRRRIGVRQRALAIGTLADYAEVVRGDPGEVERLLGSLTINVSEFLRNPSLFRLLESQVVPGLLERARAERRPLEIWSAGCASGEEVYSLAILLDRMGAGRDAARLLGTDIDREAIAAARQGRFDASRMRELTAALRERYFEPAGDGRRFRVRADRLAPARFRVHDLLAAPLRRGLDLVLCRNVLIYFELDLQEAILERIVGALRPRGVLALGRVERLSGEARRSFEAIDLRERVYRKTATGASHAS
jgi:chemotaxis protein methyltransferase CheR